MKLIINGEPRTFDAVTNVAELIEKLAIKGDRVAVELNSEIVPRSQWTVSALNDGDKLEIVHFVGGGRCSDRLCHSRSAATKNPY
jgi:thiamine biosynthesis protein ThiS